MSCEKWYINILVKQPYVVLIFISVISCICLVVPFTMKSMNFRSFQEPQLGFLTRNTKISNRLISWQNLQKSWLPSGFLVKNPKEYLMIEQRRKTEKPNNNKIHNHNRKGKKNKAVYGKMLNVTNGMLKQKQALMNKWNVLRNFTDYNPKRMISDKEFCGRADEAYVQIVVQAINGDDLFTLENLQSLCKLERIIMNLDTIPGICIENTQVDYSECCKPWSLTNYIAALSDKSNCLLITEEDLNRTRLILEECIPYFIENKLYTDGAQAKENNVSSNCIKHDAVYSILYYLTSTSFYSENATLKKLKETILFLPVAQSLSSVPLYHQIDNLGRNIDTVKIVAIDFGIKELIFNEYLKNESYLMILGAIFVFVCVWLYTKSLFLTVMTIISILYVLIISYFLYEFVYGIKFFPFMNMLTIVICIGIGADNVFIMCKFWHINKIDRSNKNDLSKIMKKTFRHGFKALLVTSLTTAVAFWGSAISAVTAIRCFSIFTGTAIIINFLLTLSWIPACIVIREKSSCETTTWTNTFCCLSLKSATVSRCRKRNIWNGKEEFLIRAIIRLRYFWIVTMTFVAIINGFIVFVYPGLKLPTSMEFQLLMSDHPFEQYDLIYRNKFLFRQEKGGYNISEFKFPLRFVWGVRPVDNGNRMDPTDFGKLELDPTFNMSAPDSQQWLHQFCRNIQRQPFYEPVLGVSLTSCFIQTFAKSMKYRSCFDVIDVKKSVSPCCKSSPFPFNSTVFDQCILDEMSETYGGPPAMLYPNTAGAYFSKDKNPKIKAVVVEFQSRTPYTLSYHQADNFYKQVEKWTKLQMVSAPSGMTDGFFVSELSFYDVQSELARGTKTAILVSMILALIVIFLSTLNVMLTILAVITILGTIITTVGVLILHGWSLNILESVAISTSIGLAVDFSLHYCINYKLCPPNFTKTRQDATHYALSSLMGPSFMAGLTTAFAGYFMLFSSVLPCYQIGFFLVLVMVLSWSYATFLLGSLLIVFGPINNFCQFSWMGFYQFIFCRSQPNNTDNNEVIVSTSTTDVDSELFLKGNTKQLLVKSFIEPCVRYTQNHDLPDQSPISNVTIITPECKTLV